MFSTECEAGAYKSALNFITLLRGLSKEFLDNKFVRVTFWPNLQFFVWQFSGKRADENYEG